MKHKFSLAWLLTVLLFIQVSPVLSLASAKERPRKQAFPTAEEFDANLGIVQSSIEGDNPFLTLTLTNKSPRTLTFPKAWLDPELENVRISQQGKDLEFLATNPLPKVDLSPAILLPPNSEITIVMGMPGHVDFSFESNRGWFVAKWIHHEKAACRFAVSDKGRLTFE